MKLDELQKAERLEARSNAFAWSALTSPFLQSVCTAVIAASGMRFAIGLATFITSFIATSAPAQGLHRDLIRLPMLIFALAGAGINLGGALAGATVASPSFGAVASPPTLPAQKAHGTVAIDHQRVDGASRSRRINCPQSNSWVFLLRRTSSPPASKLRSQPCAGCDRSASSLRQYRSTTATPCGRTPLGRLNDDRCSGFRHRAIALDGKRAAERFPGPHGNDAEVR